MKLYECNNIVQVAHKVAELTNTKLNRDDWKYYCNELKRNRFYTTDSIDYTAFDNNGNEIDVKIILQFDKTTRQFLVGVEE